MRIQLRNCVAALFCIFFVAILTGCGDNGDSPSGGGDRLKMGLMPKLVGISYFNACERGAREAAAELGIDLDYDGPATDDVEQQTQLIDTWIAKGYDIIAVAPNDPEVIAPALKRARDAGITVLTWDADANPKSSAREVFVNQAPVEGIGQTLVDLMADATGGAGKVLIVTGSATSPNQNDWIKAMRAHMAAEYPDMRVLEPLVSNENQALAQQLTADALNAHPDLVGVWGITSVSLPGAAKAVRDAGKSGDVYVTGLSLPSEMAEYVKDGTVPQFVLWNPVDLGYLTVHVASRLAKDNLTNGTHTMGRLKDIRVEGDEVILGDPLVFDRENIDEFDF